jgi:hypothetical protein
MSGPFDNGGAPRWEDRACEFCRASLTSGALVVVPAFRTPDGGIGFSAITRAAVFCAWSCLSTWAALRAGEAAP